MRRLFIFAVCALALAAAAPNDGTVKVHEGEPGRRNDPKVACSFHFHELGDETGGTWTVLSWPPTGDKTVVATGSGTVDVTLTPGHYRVEWQTGSRKSTKHKMFWVEPCPAPTASPSPSPTASPRPTPRVVLAGVVDGPAPTLPPTNMAAVAQPVSPGWFYALFALIMAASVGWLSRR